MVDIRIRELPTASPAVSTDWVPIDNGTTRKISISDLVDVGRPFATQPEAEAGVNSTAAMSPLTTAQAIAAQGASLFASAAEGLLASTALQPSAIGVTIASAAQGAKADTALQPGDIGVSVGNMLKATYDPQSKNADAFLSSNTDFIRSETGAAERSVQTKLREYASFADFGAIGDGTTDDSTAVTNALATGRVIDGHGLTYAVSAVPTDFTNIRRAAFKSGSITYISRDFLRTETSKITNGYLYVGWAEDKSYLVGDQIRVWGIEKESHADGTGRVVLTTSDDGGASFAPLEYLALAASGRTLWCAGYDSSSSTEYLIVRVPAGSTDVPPYTYERWSRTITLDSSGDLNTAPWTTTAITFPTPAGFTGQPIMVISFTTGHAGSIVVGTSYTEGAAVARSTDAGATWTSFILATGTDNEEPTVKYHAASQRYYGFMRNGGTGNPRFWHSGVDDLASISTYTAPVGTFGPNGLSDSPVPFAIDFDRSRIRAFTSYRNGTIEGAASDELTSAFYLDLPILAGNVWGDPSSKIYRLGTLPHRETGGASAVGVGSVLIQDDKVHLFYGMEDRTGAFGTWNRIVNIYQTIVYLTDRNGMFDFRNDIAVNRSTGPWRKAPNNGGMALYLGDLSGDLPALFSGRPNFALRNSSIVISSGVATLTGRFGHYLIDTEGGAATDDLDTITDANAQMGDVIILSSTTSTRDVTVKNGTGNILCGADRLLSQARDRIMLQYTNIGGSPVWSMISFGDNA